MSTGLAKISGGNYDVEKRLARYLKRLPDESVTALAKTDFQIREILQRRNFTHLTARYWESRITFQDDPLSTLLESGQISEATRMHIACLVDFFQRLWGVIQTGWRHIKAELGSGCPFGYAHELFTAILRVWFNNDYATCLQPYWELSVADCHASFKLAQGYSNSALKKDGISRLKSISAISAQFTNPWLAYSLSLCIEKSSSDPSLKRELKGFDSSILEFCNFGQDWTGRKRGSKKYPKLHSVQYKNGLNLTSH